MPSLALAVIDALFGLALFHDNRGRRVSLPDHDRARVRAEVRGPRASDPEGALEFEVIVTYEPRETSGEAILPIEQRVRFMIDLELQRILAGELSLAELNLDRSGMARLIAELETWCYDRVPTASRDG